MKKENEQADSKMDAMSDTAKYAAGKEGDSIADDTNENDISPEEIALLDAAGEDDEERELHEAELDNTDNEGEALNERSSANAKSGSDLDIPGAADDDEDEAIGEEDEENNDYSEADTE